MIKLKDLLMESPDFISVELPNRNSFGDKLSEYRDTMAKYVPGTIGQWHFHTTNEGWRLTHPQYESVCIEATPFRNGKLTLEFNLKKENNVIDSWLREFKPTKNHQKDADRYMEIMVYELAQILPITLEN